MKVYFEDGIPGLDEYKSYEIKDVEGSDKFKTMISVEEPNVGFVVISPFYVNKDYEINLNGEIIKSLQIEDPKDVLVLNLITLGKTLEKSTVNLKAPVIINIKNNKGKQFILQDDKYSIRQPLI